MKSVSVALVAAAVCQTEGLRGTSNREKLQPQVVAHTLVQMEDEWRSQATLFAECNATAGRAAAVSCSAAFKAFEKSCATVAKAVQQASSGDRAVVKEYMGDICSQSVLDGWRRERCQSFATTISGSMSADNYENREDLNVAGICKNYWSTFLAAETTRVAKEHAEGEAKRVAREAEERKLAAEHAEAAKKAAVEAAKKAAEKAKQEAKKAKEEAEKRMAEAKQKADEEAKRKAVEATHKKAEDKAKAQKNAAELKAQAQQAQHKAEEAKKKMEDAKAAADKARTKREATAVKTQSKAGAASVADVKKTQKVDAKNTQKVDAKNTQKVDAKNTQKVTKK